MAVRPPRTRLGTGGKAYGLDTPRLAGALSLAASMWNPSDETLADWAGRRLQFAMQRQQAAALREVIPQTAPLVSLDTLTVLLSECEGLEALLEALAMARPDLGQCTQIVGALGTAKNPDKLAQTLCLLAGLLEGDETS